MQSLLCKCCIRMNMSNFYYRNEKQKYLPKPTFNVLSPVTSHAQDIAFAITSCIVKSVVYSWTPVTSNVKQTDLFACTTFLAKCHTSSLRDRNSRNINSHNHCPSRPTRKLTLIDKCKQMVERISLRLLLSTH